MIERRIPDPTAAQRIHRTPHACADYRGPAGCLRCSMDRWRSRSGYQPGDGARALERRKRGDR